MLHLQFLSLKTYARYHYLYLSSLSLPPALLPPSISLLPLLASYLPPYLPPSFPPPFTSLPHPPSPPPSVGEVYNVEIALDLKELNSITRQRQSLRGSLEKAIAYYEATNVRPEVFIQTGKVTIKALLLMFVYMFVFTPYNILFILSICYKHLMFVSVSSYYILLIIFTSHSHYLFLFYLLHYIWY